MLAEKALPPFEERGYRPCVGIMMLNRAGHVFVGHRLDAVVEAWQMPQGGIDEGEDPWTAALRELSEETGTTNVEKLGQTEGWLNYDLPESLADTLWKGRYRGQTQKWFAVRFLGTDADINLRTHTPEFKEWQWTPIHTLPDLIVPFKRDLYAKLVEHFRHLV